MKLDEGVRMISAEAPVMFAKACEMFIMELTLRAWTHTEENKRRTLQVPYSHRPKQTRADPAFTEKRYCHGNHEDRHVRLPD
jgi:hypothetical protein